MACVDVDYRDDGAVAACLWFADWADAEPVGWATTPCGAVAPYEPGAFTRRELPCLLGVLAGRPRFDRVVVDGYAWLEQGAPGLGARLHLALGVPVVGVAKTRYAGAAGVVEVCRGASRAPLFVSAAGTDVARAAADVARMHGPHRVPTLLRRVDALARSG